MNEPASASPGTGTWDWSPSDLAALERFLGATGLETRRIGDGHSNLTYLVTGPGTRVVVRRPPPPPLPPGAHDVLREARMVAGVAGHGVPVPDVLGTAEAGEVIDAPLYVMSHVNGPVVTTETPESLRGERRAIAESFVDTLAALHVIDPRAAGLDGMGRPEGFNARHLRRMRQLLDPYPPEWSDLDTWLHVRVPPESGAAIVHSDYRLGNVILAPDPPGTVAAVLDWELATIGDPLADVGYLLATWPESGEPVNPVAAMGTAALEPGWPTRDDLIDRYAAATGRDLSDVRWFTVLALWKLAVLFEYNHRRAVAGGGDPYYADPALVGSFLDAARTLAERR